MAFVHVRRAKRRVGVTGEEQQERDPDLPRPNDDADNYGLDMLISLIDTTTDTTWDASVAVSSVLKAVV